MKRKPITVRGLTFKPWGERVYVCVSDGVRRAIGESPETGKYEAWRWVKGVMLAASARTPRQAVLKLLALETRVWRELDHDWSTLDD